MKLHTSASYSSSVLSFELTKFHAATTWNFFLRVKIVVNESIHKTGDLKYMFNIKTVSRRMNPWDLPKAYRQW